MKKTLVALAALAATASFAQSSSVEIYGRGAIDFSNYSATGATTAANDITGRSRVADFGSRFGLRVNEDLGGGTRAFMLCETGMNVDNANVNSQQLDSTSTASGYANPNANTNFLCSREGHVGIGNASAELRLGRQNVFWTAGEINQTGANFISGDVLTNFYGAGMGYVSAAGVSRLANTALVQFNKDMVGAFAGSHIYRATTGEAGDPTGAAAVNTLPTAAGGATTSPANKAGYTQGGKLNYSSGPYLAMYDMVQQRNTANNVDSRENTNRDAWRLGLGYKYAEGSVISLLTWSHEIKYTNATSAAETPSINPTAGTTTTSANGARGNRKQGGTGINLVHKLGGGYTALAQYGIQGNLKANGAEVADTGAKAVMVALKKDLSKRTHVFAQYSKYTTDTNGYAGFGGASYGSDYAGAAGQLKVKGADPTVIGVGIIHNF